MSVCSTCNLKIEPPSPIATYENRHYHPDCLKCNVCFKSLSGKQFVKEKNGTLTCEDCNSKLAPKCTKCKISFAPGESYKKLGNEVYYHNQCFKCCGPCRKPIGAEFYDIENGKFLCTECYDKYGNDYEKYIDNDLPPNMPPPPVPQSSPPQRKENPDDGAKNIVNNFSVNLSLNDKSKIETLPAVQREPAKNNQSIAPAKPASPEHKPATTEDLKCAKCGDKISGTFTVYNEKKYHAKCFVCCQCNQEFKEKTFFKLNGNPLCRTCHSKNLVANASSCRKCEQPILDTVVTFKGGEYHDYCLICTLCSKKLVGQSIYTDKSDKPFCIECFTKKEGKYCGKCNKIIAPNQTNLVFEDKNFHKECFTCVKCSK